MDPCGGVGRVGEEVVVVDHRHVRGGDHLPREPTAMKAVDGHRGGGGVDALHIDIALRRGLVDVDMHHLAVLEALLHHVVPHLLVPVGFLLRGRVEHV